MILMNVQYCSSDASVTPARYLINQDKAYCVALKEVVDLLPPNWRPSGRSLTEHDIVPKATDKCV
jgi:hypothetical protein